MKTTDIIRQNISKIPVGKIFTYNDFPVAAEHKEALYKGLNRMASSGQIAKLTNGRFYKPRDTVFGKLKPSLDEQIKDLLEKNGKPIGYISGLGALNYLGLTTQVSNTITIYTQTPRKPVTRDTIKVSFIRQKNSIKKSNIKLLQILDSLKLVNRIPDADPVKICYKFKQILQELTESEVTNIVNLSFSYPPRTRALLGAFLDDIGKTDFKDKIKSSLKPNSSYKITIIAKELNNAKKWGIK